MQTAVVIGHITVRDPKKWQIYRERVAYTLAPWNGEVIFRGQQTEVLSGDHSGTDMVVIRFPDITSVRGWYRSPAYQELIPIRDEAAEVVLICYEL